MMSRQHVWVWDAIGPMAAVLVMLAMFTMAGCTGPRQARNAPLQEAGPSSHVDSDDTRGIHIDVPVEPLGLDHTLQVHRSKDGAPRELHDGGTVMTGDRIHASVQTSTDAYLYFAFCAHQQLTVYPSRAGIRTVAGQRMVVPSGGTELVIDGEPGPEVLYVILSRAELPVVDSPLAAALEAKSPRNTPMDCRASLETRPVKPPSNPGGLQAPAPSPTKVMRGKVVRRRPLPPPRGVRSDGPAGNTQASSTRVRRAGTAGAPASSPDEPIFAAGAQAAKPPEPDFERNPGNIVWYRVDGVPGPQEVVAADDGGIVVVRHEFQHVPQAPSP
jgi:hypothetical protein